MESPESMTGPIISKQWLKLENEIRMQELHHAQTKVRMTGVESFL